MSHLQAGPSEPTLDVKALVCLAAVQYTFIAPHLRRNIVQSLNNPQTKLLALLVFCYCDIFDVANRAETMNTVKMKKVSCRIGVTFQLTGTYNFFSTSRAPVPTTIGFSTVVSSMTRM